MIEVYEPQTSGITPAAAWRAFTAGGWLPVKAERLINDNISALLTTRGLNQKELAQWCRKTEVWISFKLSGKRQWSVDELDRVADFFGVAAYQLLQPGIAKTTERRRGRDRREGRDRRQSAAQRVMHEVGIEVESARAHGGASSNSALISEIRRLTTKHERELSDLISRADVGGRAARARAAVAAPRAGDRARGAADAAAGEGAARQRKS